MQTYTDRSQTHKHTTIVCPACTPRYKNQCYTQGRRQEFEEGGAELKGCEAPGFWRRAPKIFGNRKPHLLINDSIPGIVVVPGVLASIQGAGVEATGVSGCVRFMMLQ